jgi:hypothetical protein
MGRKNFTPEQIISKLREAEVLLSKGESTDMPHVIVPPPELEMRFYKEKPSCATT